MSAPENYTPMMEAAQQPFEAKYIKGVASRAGRRTNIDAYAIVERLEQMFGPAGLGWGLRDLRFNVHTTTHQKHGETTSVSCAAVFWYRWQGEEAEFGTVGSSICEQGDVAESHKAAMTNALSKATSYIGFGRDIYLHNKRDDAPPEGGDAPNGDGGGSGSVVQDRSPGKYTHTGTPLRMETKSGHTNGRDWKIYKLFVEGIERDISTFSESDAGAFESALQRDEQVTVEYESKQKGQYVNRELISIAIATGNSAPPAAAAAPSAGNTIRLDVEINGIESKKHQGRDLWGIQTSQGMVLTYDPAIAKVIEEIKRSAKRAELGVRVDSNNKQWVESATAGVASDDIPF